MNNDSTWKSVRSSVGYLRGISNAPSIWNAIGREAKYVVEASVEHFIWRAVDLPVWNALDELLEEITYE